MLPSPVSGPVETLSSLRRCAAAAGWQVALLPRGSSWRDQPERLFGLHSKDPSDVILPLYQGSFSLGGDGEELAPHADLLEHGAIGLADDNRMIPVALLERGLTLGEMGSCPVLLAARDPLLQGDGLVREGWKPCGQAGLPITSPVSFSLSTSF